MAQDFNVGDHVVYPPHGAGTVTARETRDGFDSELLSIYVQHSKMTLSVPADAAANKGVRKIMDKKALKAVQEILRGEDEALPDNPQHRRAHTESKAKTGSFTELAEVIRDLAGREAGGKKLSPVEMANLASAKQHLASEIMLLKGGDIEDATKVIDKALGEAVRPDPPEA